MKSIKNSFANCSVCPLLDAPSCILETNCMEDLSKVELVFIAENPGKDEVRKGLPLVGKAGQMFRKYFRKFKLDKKKYLLTNVVLCQTINDDGTTGNPEKKVIELCKVNCMEIIKACSPKIVVLMGTSPMSAFDLGKDGITKIHGDVVEWNGQKTLIMVHPSFVNRNLATWEHKFEEAMAKVAELMGEKIINLSNEEKTKVLSKGIYRYKIPDKFYTDEYRLVDIQFLNKTNQVLYIFRDKDNNKVYHKMHDEYICYQCPEGIDPEKIVEYDKLNQISIKYKDRFRLDPDITYEGDIKIATKHAMDYYHFNKGEPSKTNSNIMFFDIEVDTGEERVFPVPTEAAFPINMLTTIYDGVTTHYVVDNKTEPINKKDGILYKVFTDEKKLLKEFIKDFRKADPDFLAGWNCISFDLAYIFNRMPKLGMNQTAFSKFGEFYVDASKYICHLPGCVAVDQDFLYKTFTFTKMENYKLSFIADHELDGFTKIDLPLPFNEMYWKMLNKTIEYNIRDTELLQMLDDKLDHINLLNELRIVCNAAFENTSSFGQIDSLMVSFLREKGWASKNANSHIKKERYPGAFVFEPTPGVYENVTDFDFASLYPSLMLTYNIGVNSFVMKTKEPTLGYELAYCPENLPDKIQLIIDPMYKSIEMTVTKEQLFKKIKENNMIYTINGCFFKPHDKEMSVFGVVVDDLMSSRKVYKGKMFKAIEEKNKGEEIYYYTRQLVYKVLANTLYGVVANKAFRFFDVSLAAAITISGQEALKTSIIEGDAFMRHLDTGKNYEVPPPLTKKEVFGDRMPSRSNEYIVTGDTDSIFCCFENFKEEKTVRNIHKWCEKIEKFLNEDRIVNVVKKHNVDPKYNRLVLKNELVISRGLFLAKKRYAIRVINNEGKDVDKINYMGVEIKRSDYPSKSKEFLSELLDLILKSDKVVLSRLLEFVQAKEKEFLPLVKSGDKSISRPVSYGKQLKDYKTIPQGVRAMETWNKIMYNIHKPGTKSYMYWVSGIDVEKAPEDVVKRYYDFIKDGNKLEVIAIPDEESKLPDFFIPDVKSAMNFVFKDRYELMLEPLLGVKGKKMDGILTI